MSPPVLAQANGKLCPRGSTLETADVAFSLGFPNHSLLLVGSLEFRLSLILGLWTILAILSCRMGLLYLIMGII